MSDQASVGDYDSVVAPVRPEKSIPAINGGYLTPWQKGVSGNPGGRSKRFHQVQELARENSVAAINKLADLMEAAADRKYDVQTATPPSALN